MGLSAIEVIERVVEVPTPPSSAPPSPRNQEWRAILRELTRQLDSGPVYDRHVVGIGVEVSTLRQALRRRGAWGDGASSVSPHISRASQLRPYVCHA